MRYDFNIQLNKSIDINTIFSLLVKSKDDVSSLNINWCNPVGSYSYRNHGIITLSLSQENVTNIKIFSSGHIEFSICNPNYELIIGKLFDICKLDQSYIGKIKCVCTHYDSIKRCMCQFIKYIEI